MNLQPNPRNEQAVDKTLKFTYQWQTWIDKLQQLISNLQQGVIIESDPIFNASAAKNITTAQIAAFHSHLNKAVLDSIDAAFTLSLKAIYDTAASYLDQSVKKVSTPEFANIIDNGLSASQAVLTDANKKLVSLDYLDQAVKTTSTPTFANVTDSGLTASQAVMTDANKKLVSADYLDQAVKQASSPQFVNIVATGDIYRVAENDYSASSTVNGWAATPTVSIRYKLIGKTLIVDYDIQGTSNHATTNFTIPFNSKTTGVYKYCTMATTMDNSVQEVAGYIAINSASNVVLCKRSAAAAFTSSGTKVVQGQLIIEIA